MYDKTQAFRQEALFGGEGLVWVWDLAPGLAPFSAALAIELAPGGRVGAHVQAEYPELVLFAEGDGEVEVDGVKRAVGPGALVALALGSVLAIANPSPSVPLRYFIVKAGV